MRTILCAGVFVLVLLASASQAAAQCNPTWVPGQGVPGVFSRGLFQDPVRCLATWDPDGPGPLSNRIVVGGRFSLAGDVHAFNVAEWDPVSESWSALGLSVNETVAACLALPSGDLIVAGDFTVAGGVVTNRIARWDGSTWSALGTGCDAEVLALAVMPNGDIVAGGRFEFAGGVAVNGVARWDGSSWSSLGAGVVGIGSNQHFAVLDLVALPNGDLVAGGRFPLIGSAVASNVARWDGTSWSAMAAGIGSAGNDLVKALSLRPNGDVVAAGCDGGTYPVVSWDGTAWVALGLGMDGCVEDLITMPGGDLLAVGVFHMAGGVAVERLARWDGSAWSSILGGFAGLNLPSSLAALPNGDFFVGGHFNEVGGVAAASVVRRRGAAWQPMGSGTSASVRVLLTQPNGDVLAGGLFDMIGGTPASAIARWDGTSWFPVGPRLFEQVSAIATLPGGDVVAAGLLNTGGPGLARWNGTAWCAIVSEIDSMSVR